MDVHDASADGAVRQLDLLRRLDHRGRDAARADQRVEPQLQPADQHGAPAYFPAYEDGGIGGLVSGDGASHINSWLSTFPGRYVGLAYGTNDANGCMSPTGFYNNYVTMVQAVINVGKVPIVPTIPWARTQDVQNCGPGLNAKIQQLYANFPQVVHGPDLWQFFFTHQNLISGDNLHPSEAGYVAYRQQWADAMVANVYGPYPSMTCPVPGTRRGCAGPVPDLTRRPLYLDSQYFAIRGIERPRRLPAAGDVRDGPAARLRRRREAARRERRRFRPCRGNGLSGALSTRSCRAALEQVDDGLGEAPPRLPAHEARPHGART